MGFLSLLILIFQSDIICSRIKKWKLYFNYKFIIWVTVQIWVTVRSNSEINLVFGLSSATVLLLNGLTIELQIKQKEVVFLRQPLSGEIQYSDYQTVT
jgi:hypothetical protein